MQREEGHEGERDPEPGHLDEEDVEEVALAREVAGRGGGRVRLRDGVVGGGARAGVEEGEERAEEEGRGVEGEEERLERGGEEGCEVAGWVVVVWWLWLLSLWTR